MTVIEVPIPEDGQRYTGLRDRGVARHILLASRDVLEVMRRAAILRERYGDRQYHSPVYVVGVRAGLRLCEELRIRTRSSVSMTHLRHARGNEPWCCVLFGRPVVVSAELDVDAVTLGLGAPYYALSDHEVQRKLDTEPPPESRAIWIRRRIAELERELVLLDKELW